MRFQTRIPLALGLVFASYALWANLTSWLVPTVYGYSCVQQFFTLSCAFPADRAEVNAGYFVLLGFVLFTAAALRVFWHSTASYPFLMLSAALCTAALGLDIIAQRPVLFGPKIINDTVNVLGAVIAASFTLLIILCRKVSFSLVRLALAVGISYGLTAISVIAFIELSSSVFGVTELFMLYVIYAFGSFTIHLMTVCGFVATLPIAQFRYRHA